MKLIPTMYMYKDEEACMQIVKNLVELNINKLRINCTRFTVAEYLNQIALFRKCFNHLSVEPEIYIDLPVPGDKIRMKYLSIDEGFRIIQGEFYTIEFFEGQEINQNKLYIENMDFFSDLSIGEKLLLGDGNIILKVISKSTKSLCAEALHSGILNYKKSIYSEKHTYSKGLLDESVNKYAHLIEMSKPAGVMLSFVEEVTEILAFKNRFPNIKIIPKIETPRSVNNINEIIKHCQTIMLGRGDLGNIASYDLGKFQELLIRICKISNKEIIIATDILSSLTEQELPRRSEIMDLYYLKKNKVDSVVIGASLAKNKTALKKFVQFVEKTKIV